MTFLSYKKIAVLFVAITLVLSGFMAFGSAGVQGQFNLGDTVATGAGIDDNEFCSLSSGLSVSDVESITGKWGGLCSYSLAKFIVNWVSIIVGVIALLFMMYAAFLFISGKSSESAGSNKNARNVLIAAIVGFTIVVLSQAILRLIIGLFG